MRHGIATIVLLLSACNFQAPELVQQQPNSAVDREQGSPVANAVPMTVPPSARTESDSPVTAALKTDKSELHPGDALTVIIEVHIAPSWHIYAMDRPAGPALPTVIAFELPKSFEWDGKWISSEPSLLESTAGGPSFGHEGSVSFRRKVHVSRDASAGAIELRGTLHYQACDLFSCRAPAHLALQAKINVVR
jgi:DsbC/DsbD-like thiol-disulfide interchange protein